MWCHFNENNLANWTGLLHMFLCCRWHTHFKIRIEKSFAVYFNVSSIMKWICILEVHSNEISEECKASVILWQGPTKEFVYIRVYRRKRFHCRMLKQKEIYTRYWGALHAACCRIGQCINSFCSWRFWLEYCRSDLC